MMNERIVLARQFLRFDGTFFTSVDFNEISVLKTSLDVIFGENLEGLISWRRRHNQPNDPTKMIGLVAEYLLAYARDATALRESGVGKVDLTGKYANPDNDPRGDWSSKPWKAGSGQSGTRYVIKTPKGRKLDEEWMGDESTYKNPFGGQSHNISQEGRWITQEEILQIRERRRRAMCHKLVGAFIFWRQCGCKCDSD